MSSERQQKEPFKLRDHVGLLQDTFQQYLQAIIDSIGRIWRDAGNQNNAFTYEDIPKSAQCIIFQALRIDALIDEAKNSTYLSKPIPEILESIKELSAQNIETTKSLENEIADAESMMLKMNAILDTVADNTPWLKNVVVDEDQEDSG